MASVATKPFRAAARSFRLVAGRARTLVERARGRYRAHRPAPAHTTAPTTTPVPTTALTRAPHPYWRASGLVAVTLLGAWLGLLVVGSVDTPVGPVDTRMTLRPSLTGGTKVNVSPLGALELRSHYAPLRLDVDVDRLDQERASALVDHPERIEGLEDEISSDVGSGALGLGVRSVVAVVTGACALGLVVYRRPRRALAVGGLALTLLAACGATALATWNPKSVLEPKFSGLLASAPSVVGNARSIATEFDVYQRELARLVTNVTKLYDAASTLPAYEPDPSTTRVLHVSDIHLNPAAWHIIRSLVKQYEIDVIIDSGDTMDHGTSAENGFLDPIPDLGAPYVWVRGNHDSPATQQAVKKLGRRHGARVHVLDSGVPVNVAGLRLAGWGDPQFTPDRSVAAEGDPAEETEGGKLAASLRAQRDAGTPVDIAVGHNPVLAQQTDGLVPLALTGHTHNRRTKTLEHGTRMMTQGSTGGSGLRAVEGRTPDKVQASVLYLDRDSRRLQAWDEITLGGLGLSKAEVARHLPEEVKPGAPPSPALSPSPSPSPPPGSPPPSPLSSPSSHSSPAWPSARSSRSWGNSPATGR
ncbi:metallophosphoesterase [Streptomyces axinellae]|uniref:Metallophosphoesterase n=1 Tax=Streptomyces axinellae TaxID=552788 RepID=A0ABN3PWG8_9ACTN